MPGALFTRQIEAINRDRGPKYRRGKYFSGSVRDAVRAHFNTCRSPHRTPPWSILAMERHFEEGSNFPGVLKYANKGLERCRKTLLAVG